MWHQFVERVFNVYDRKEDLKQAAPPEVRRASHELSNATMAAQGSMHETRKNADALTALVEKMQREERKQ